MKLYCVLFVLILSILLCACSPTKHTENYIEIDDEQNSLLYVSSEHDYDELLEVLSFKPSVEELDRSVQLDFVKITASGFSTILRTKKRFHFGGI